MLELSTARRLSDRNCEDQTCEENVEITAVRQRHLVLFEENRHFTNAV